MNAYLDIKRSLVTLKRFRVILKQVKLSFLLTSKKKLLKIRGDDELVNHFFTCSHPRKRHLYHHFHNISMWSPMTLNSLTLFAEGRGYFYLGYIISQTRSYLLITASNNSPRERSKYA